MQFDAEPPFAHAITGHGAEGIAIAGQWHRHSLLVGADGLLLPWPVQQMNQQTDGALRALSEADLAPVLAQAQERAYELLIVGTGQRQNFLPLALLRPFMQHGLPVECMSTPAACRTYNIVAAEGRRVLAALRIDA
ncbi:MAG: Mth938-like domain-containing protein [Brachymonas sp.]|nr:Mth938-like domain-containing protein [Brachymonas sp.]